MVFTVTIQTICLCWDIKSLYLNYFAGQTYQVAHAQIPHSAEQNVQILWWTVVD
jgi:hypothetical protein